MKEIRQALEQRAYLRFPNQATKEELKAADVWLEALNLFDGLMAGKVIVPVEPLNDILFALKNPDFVAFCNGDNIVQDSLKEVEQAMLSTIGEQE